MISFTKILHRWVDPEFEDEEDMSRVEEANGREEEVAIEVEGDREVVDNVREEEEEIIVVHMEDNIVVDMEMEELQSLKAKQ